MRLVKLGVPKDAGYVVGRRVLTIGSAADNDVVLPYSAISRYHATIRQRLGRCILTDLNSTNGVIVNGRKVDGQLRLRPGDDIRFAGARFTLRHRKSFYAATIGATMFVTLGIAFAAMTIVTERFTRTPEPTAPVRAAASRASPGGTQMRDRLRGLRRRHMAARLGPWCHRELRRPLRYQQALRL